jgi:hypothetical protein
MISLLEPNSLHDQKSYLAEIKKADEHNFDVKKKPNFCWFLFLLF